MVPQKIPLEASFGKGTESFVQIPDVLISRETLIHIGFTPEKATEIYNRWSDWPIEGGALAGRETPTTERLCLRHSSTLPEALLLANKTLLATIMTRDGELVSLVVGLIELPKRP